jgi:hypothetical protein
VTIKSAGKRFAERSFGSCLGICATRMLWFCANGFLNACHPGAEGAAVIDSSVGTENGRPRDGVALGTGRGIERPRISAAIGLGERVHRSLS